MSNIDEIIRKIKEENDPFSKAKYIKYLIEEKNIKIKDIAEKLNLTSSYICHLNRLNHLPEIVIDGYYSKLISLSHLFIISRLKEKNKIIELYEKIISNNLTIIDTENQLRSILYSFKPDGKRLSNEEIEKIKKNITNIFPKARINILQIKSKLKIEINVIDNLKNTSLILKKINKIFNEATLAKD